MRLAAFVGRQIRVKVVRPCRINLDPVLQMPLGQPLEEDRLCRGAAADVAHANEQNFEFGLVHFESGSGWISGQV
jgi:hypothetical protein